MSEPFTHVIVPLDGSQGAELALAPAESIAMALGAAMILMRATRNTSVAVPIHEAVPGAQSAVVAGPSSVAEFGNMAATPVLGTPETMQPVEDTEASGYLHLRAEELRRRGLTVYEELHNGDPVSGILGLAGLHERSLIVITGHSRSGIERLFFGSTADDLIRRAPCPVLFIRRDDAA